MKTKFRLRWFLFYEALVFGLGLMLAAGQIPMWGQWYSQSEHHRSQVESLLHGSLALATNPAAMTHDLAWAQGGVQQVWGLGVPLWRLPFEALWRLLGQRGFPDMLALAAAVGLAAWWLLRALVETAPGIGTAEASPAGSGSAAAIQWNAFSVCWCACAAALVLLFPPFVTLFHSRFDIYEEVVAYEYLYGVALIANLLLFAHTGSRGRFWFLCTMAGLGGLVRPTLVFHGAAVVAAGGLVLWWKGRANGDASRRVGRFWKTAVVGVLLFVAGGTVLYVTNQVRFGSGFEFGHRLNVQHFYGSLYATRFDDPFGREPLLPAARELFGLLFLAKEFSGGSFYLPEFFPGQSATVRWREMYSTTYDLSFFLLLATGVGVGLACLRKLWRSHRQTEAGRSAPGVLSTAALAVFGVLASAGLLGFYLRNGVISSRYLMDLMPAFAALVLAGWLAWGNWCVARPRRGWLLFAAVGLLTAWLAWQIGRGSSAYGPPHTLTWKEIEQRHKRPLAAVKLPDSARYDSPAEAVQTKMPYNGAGWEPETGMVKPCVILFVEAPEFIELEIAPITGEVTGADLDHLRAKIGLEFLERESVRKTARGWLVRFHGPKRTQYQRGLQPAFLATVPNPHLADTTTPWRLLKVRWREVAEASPAK